MTAHDDKNDSSGGPCENTDREIYREPPGDYYAYSIHVTKGGGIGINVGGTVYVKPLAEWHRLAGGPFTLSHAPRKVPGCHFPDCACAPHDRCVHVDAALAERTPSTTRQTAKQQFAELLVEDAAPLERLRLFCSLAMNGQDWLDVEPFFDALETTASATPRIPGLAFVTNDGVRKVGLVFNTQEDADAFAKNAPQEPR